MNLYGTDQMVNLDRLAESNDIQELLLVEEILHGTDEQIHEFCESPLSNVLLEKSVLKKPTLVRLGKIDDAKRRTKLMAYQLAKESNDPNWTKLKKIIVMKKQTVRKIMAKYGPKAVRLAKLSQKNYIKNAKSLKASPAEMKAQNAR
jgi:hypothetical protein